MPANLKESEAAAAREGSLVSNINKYTISIILNTYNFDGGVDPSFVQSMFTYMQNNPTSLIPDHMEAVRFKPFADAQAVLLPEFIRTRVSIGVDLRSFGADADKWLPTMTTQCKCSQNIILKFTQAVPVLHDKAESCDTYSSPTFSKIVKQFEMVRESMAGATDNVALVEGEDEDQEDDEGDEESSAHRDGDSQQDMSVEEVEAALQHTHLGGGNEGSLLIGQEDDGAEQDGGVDAQGSVASGEEMYKHSPVKYTAAPPSSMPSPNNGHHSKQRFVVESTSDKGGEGRGSRGVPQASEGDEYSNTSFDEYSAHS